MKNHGLDFIEFRYRYKNILNKEDHGVSLHSEQRIGKFTSGRWKNKYDQSGYIQHRFDLTKEITKDFSLRAITRVQLYDNISNETDKTKNLYRFYIIPSYTINDRFSVSALTMYSSADTRGGKSNSDLLLVEPAVTYKMSPDVSLTVYADIVPLKSNDGRTIADDPLGNSTLAFSLAASLF